MLTVYKAGFISLDKQYLTVGVNGFIEGAEFLSNKDSKYKGLKILPDNEQYKQFTKDVLETIKQVNKEDSIVYNKFYEILINNTIYKIPNKTMLNVTDLNKNSYLKSIDEIVNSKELFDIDDKELEPYKISI